MKLNKLLGTLNIPITTTPVSVIIPKQYIGASALLIGAQYANEFIAWKRSSTTTATESKLCPEGDIILNINITQEDQMVFAASTLSGTGIIEIEVWR